MDAMLEGGARWAVEQGYGELEDLARVEERGCMAGAMPAWVSEKAKHRQQREMAIAAPAAGIHLPDRELACARIRSELGQRYLGAMRAATNCALANRQIICHLTREVFDRFFAGHRLSLLFDVSHNTCKEEPHRVMGEERMLFVHRKGATRAFGPGHRELPPSLSEVGQPVLIGGSMGTCSYVLAGTTESESRAWSSACHGAGRAMSRRAASRRWKGRSLVDELARKGILVRSPSLRGVAEEAPFGLQGRRRRGGLRKSGGACPKSRAVDPHDLHQGLISTRVRELRILSRTCRN